MPHSLQSRPGFEISVRHVFSCEIDEAKRDILLAQGGMEHLFSDVLDFEKGQAYCFICRRRHAINTAICGIDVLQTGTACTDLSRCNNDRKKHAGSYTGDSEVANGVSSLTYRAGFKKARCLKQA